MDTFDYIIIGGGTAGSLLANRLSADPRRRVLLIEAGGRDDYHWIHIPVGYLYCLGNPRTDWCFKTEPEAGLNGRQLNYPRGKVLGGCSSINGMIYMRGQSRDYDTWAAQLDAPEWSWHQCLPDFKAHEDYHAGAGDFHGAGGEWKVAKQRVHWPILDAFARAATEAGLPASADFNTGNNEGVGYFEVNQKNGWRWNTVKAFLHPTCYGRPNFEMWTHAHVDKLLFEADNSGQSRCTGVQVWSDNQMVQVYATEEVVLSAGSIGSPAILERSGVGDGARLQALGLSVIADLKGVGENLQDHVQIRTSYKVAAAKTLNTLSHRFWGKAAMATQYALTRSGPLSMAPSQLGAFAKSQPDLAWPDLEYHVQPLSLDAFGQPLHDYAAITASVCPLNPTSRGSVHIVSQDWATAPHIKPNYLSTQADQQTAVSALKLTRRIMAQPALAVHQPKEVQPGAECLSDADLLQRIGDIATTIFHPVGTAKMGKPTDRHAVLDAQMRVHGILGLRVVDASAMPAITSGNTNAPTLMMAEKAARWIQQAAARHAQNN